MKRYCAAWFTKSKSYYPLFHSSSSFPPTASKNQAYAVNIFVMFVCLHFTHSIHIDFRQNYFISLRLSLLDVHAYAYGKVLLIFCQQKSLSTMYKI